MLRANTEILNLFHIVYLMSVCTISSQKIPVSFGATIFLGGGAQTSSNTDVNRIEPAPEEQIEAASGQPEYEVSQKD